MALFKILRGLSESLDTVELHDGYAYFTPEDGMFYIDYDPQENGSGERIPINAFDRGGFKIEGTISGNGTSATVNISLTNPFLQILMNFMQKRRLPQLQLMVEDVGSYAYVYYPYGVEMVNGNPDCGVFTDGKGNFIYCNSNNVGGHEYLGNNHDHGNITLDGKLATASQAVVTDASKNITTANLATSSPAAASTTSTTFIDTVSQSANGKISATKKTLPTASTSTAGIVKLGSGDNDAAAGNHSHITNIEEFVKSESGNPIYFDDGARDIPVKELIVNLEPIQEGTGDPGPTNVKPISGYDGVTVKRTGKNILKIEGATTTTGGITFTVNSNGTITVNGTATANAWFTVQIIQKAFNADMYLSGCHSKNENIRMQVNIDNRAYQCTDEPIFIQAGKVIDTVLIRIASGTTVNNEVFDPMLRVADSTPYFSAYRGQEYPVTFPSSVYGGTLNVTTGLLTIDRYNLWLDPTKIPDNYIHFDVLTNNARIGNLILSSHFGLTSAYYAKYSSEATFRNGALSNWSVERNKGYSSDTSGFYFSGTDRFYLFCPKSIFATQDASGFKQYLTDNPLYICYELATPITYQLTPTEVSTLFMGNTIWADGETAQINLTYGANTDIELEQNSRYLLRSGETSFSFKTPESITRDNLISETTVSTSGAVTQELQPDTIYHFTSDALTSLTLTFPSGEENKQYHFDFISPSTAVTLTLPQSVEMPQTFSVEANTKYEIDILNNLGVFATGVYEVS